MNVTVPASLRTCTQGRAVVQASGDTVRELLADLERQYPGLQARLCDERGNVKKFVALFVDGRDIRTLQGDRTPLGEAADVMIVAAMAGG